MTIQCPAVMESQLNPAVAGYHSDLLGLVESNKIREPLSFIVDGWCST